MKKTRKGKGAERVKEKEGRHRQRRRGENENEERVGDEAAHGIEDGKRQLSFF